MSFSLRFLSLVGVLASISHSFVPVATTTLRTEIRSTALGETNANINDNDTGRRSFLTSAATLLLLPQVSSAAEYRQGIEVTAFNGLIFNYRGGDFGGLDASTLNEPSVPYVEFCERLKAGEVEFVEFMAPDGDAAYVTFKQKGDEKQAAPIRIGEGYPLEQHDGYSSPMFVVRTVKNFGVPYKFTVPGLAKYSS